MTNLVDVDLSETMTFVSSELGFGDGVTNVFKGDELMTRLEGDESRNGFESCLEVLGHPYRSISIDYEDYSVIEEWGLDHESTTSLKTVLEAAKHAELNINIHEHTSESEDEDYPLTVQYFGFDPSMSDFLTDPKFAEILEQYGYILQDREGKPFDCSQVDGSKVWVYDPNTMSMFPIINSGIAEASIVSEGFKLILNQMDEFLRSRENKRLILISYADGNLSEVDEDHPAHDWKFDYAIGQYVPEEDTES